MLQLGPCYPGGPSLKNSRKLPLSDLRAIFAYSLLDHPAMSRGFHTSNPDPSALRCGRTDHETELRRFSPPGWPPTPLIEVAARFSGASTRCTKTGGKPPVCLVQNRTTGGEQKWDGGGVSRMRTRLHWTQLPPGHRNVRPRATATRPARPSGGACRFGGRRVAFAVKAVVHAGVN